jgi:hypothetical protein
LADVPSAENLAARARAGSHVVLRFSPPLTTDNKADLIGRLAVSLPDHSVFDSGGDQRTSWVTVMPVVTRARVSQRRSEVLRAIGDYREACGRLVREYTAHTLSPEWQTGEHGGHCRFESRRTGQVVEAPIREWVDPDQVDPYFFSEFVKTTAGYEPVAELIDHKFHDAARILEVVSEQPA